MTGPARCDRCGEADIPHAYWLWFSNGAAIHPWCDELWDRLDELARRRIHRLAKLCREDPKAAALEAAAGGDHYRR